MDEKKDIESESCYGTSADISLKIKTEMSPELRAFAEKVQAAFPSACPYCGWKHPSEMFKLEGERWVCMKCGEAIHLLPEQKDEWPDLIA